MAGTFSRLKRPWHPMPAFVRRALKEKGLEEVYKKCPAYQQNDYVRWIMSSQREETQTKRLHVMADELTRGDVYMNMKWKPGGK